MKEKKYKIETKGFDSIEVSAGNAGKAKYKTWLSGAGYSGYWSNFIEFCKDCKVKKLA